MAVASITCPICDRENARDARRCKSCGADFEDAELAEQIGRPVGGMTDDDGDINLLGDRYLGIRWLGLEGGSDLRLIALIGAVFFGIAAILPVNLDYTSAKASWSLLSKGPTFALVLPAICAVLGIALATPLGRILPPAAVAGTLVAGGFAVLLFGLAPLGRSCGLPEKTAWFLALGYPIAAAGIAVRAMKPKDAYARWLVVGGAVLVIIGMALPHTDARPILPAEYQLVMKDRDLMDKSLLTASLAGFDHHLAVRFLSIWHLFGMLLVVAAAALTLATPKGPWDTFGLVLRPMGVALVFMIPLTTALYMINIMGAPTFDEVYGYGSYLTWDEFSDALFAGRARMLVLTIPAAIWTATGLAGLWATVVAPNLPPPPRASPPPPAPAPGL
jgi:hypothetical protein